MNIIQPKRCHDIIQSSIAEDLLPWPQQQHPFEILLVQHQVHKTPSKGLGGAGTTATQSTCSGKYVSMLKFA